MFVATTSLNSAWYRVTVANPVVDCQSLTPILANTQLLHYLSITFYKDGAGSGFAGADIGDGPPCPTSN